MTKISNYQLNTHYTALKQLPNLYSTSLYVPSQSIPAGALGRVLGTASVTVPVGVYVENILMRQSLDGDVNHVGAEIGSLLSNYCNIYISFDHVDNSHYELRVLVNNNETRAVNVPAFTASAFVRLATAPFSA